MAARWVPLESNPEVMTKYSRELGATVGQWVDVYGFDSELLDMVPQPVQAVVLLFPITEAYDESRKDEDDKIKQTGQIVAQDLYYMKQLIHNACGTVAVIHSLGNNAEAVGLTDGTLKTFLATTKGMTPYERGQQLEKSEPFTEAHSEISAEGQTRAPSSEDSLVTHFVAFIHKNGHLYELDGRRQFPINHGTTTPQNLLKDAAKLCETRIKTLESEAKESEYRFSVVAYTTGEVL